MEWDPGQYQIFTEQRTLPFRHLVAALQHLDPAGVVDLGCGSGALTATLIERWPSARITGIDTSTEMLAHAIRREIPGRLTFERGDAATWQSTQPVDLLLSNACFHWIDDHRALFHHLLPQLSDSGTLAFQVPANHAAASHTLLRVLCSSERWREQLEGHPRTGVRAPDWYLDELRTHGLEVTVWETTYHHVLEGTDPVYEWVKGTTLRPIYELLDPGDRLEFSSTYCRHLREAYPDVDGRTSFDFNRLFIIATRQC